MPDLSLKTIANRKNRFLGGGDGVARKRLWPSIIDGHSATERAGQTQTAKLAMVKKGKTQQRIEG
jgi:hypothetical protein